MQKQVKIIFHIDMNAFFASVEEIKYPFLKGKPFVVSNRLSNKGIVSTASYKAREFGVRSGMSKMDALKKCPNLIVVDHHFDQYVEYSMRFVDIVREYSELVIQASIDEVYIDMTENAKSTHPLELAKEIQQRVLKELNLSCSIGIGPTLFLAKMGSDYKKPLGITVIRKKDVPELLYPLPVGDFFGIGKQTQARLKRINILKIGDLVAKENKEKLIAFFGEEHYIGILETLKGNSSDEIIIDENASNQSLGHSRTFSRDLESDDELKKNIRTLSKMVSDRVKRHGYIGKTVTVQIKYSNLENHNCGKSVNEYIKEESEIYAVAEDLVEESWDGRPVRLLGVTLSNLVKEEDLEEEINLFSIDFFEKEQKLYSCMKEINEKYLGKVKKGLK